MIWKTKGLTGVVDKQERKVAMIMAVQEQVIVHGFAGIKVDELAKIMNVSRAKLYQYFGSKDGVITAMVQRYLDYVAAIAIPTKMETTAEFVTAFPQIFTANIAYLGTTTAVFLRDLRQDYPQLYRQFMQVRHAYNQRLLAFYRDGQVAGFFDEATIPHLAVLQDQQVIPAMLTREFLLSSGQSVAELINGYFGQVVRAIVKSDQQVAVKRALTPDQFDRVIATFSRILMV